MFNSLMDAYRNMNVSDKKTKLINEVKKSIPVLQKICDNKGISYREIDIEEMLKSNSTEELDNYLEEMFVYIMYLEELLWSYVEYTE